MAKFITQFNEYELKELISDAIRDQINQFLEPEPQKHTKSDEEFLSIEQVCKMFNVTRTTILDWRKRGLLKSISINRRVFFMRSDLLDQMKKQNRYLGEVE